MTRFAALISVIGVLVIGVLIGALGSYLYFVDEIRRPPQEQRFHPDRFVERLTDELDLTDEQLKAIRAIGRETREGADALHREMLPRVRSHMEAARARLEEIFTEEQRAKFEQMRRTERRRMEHFLLGSGRGRPRGGPRGGVRGGPPAPPPPDFPPGDAPRERPPHRTD